MSDLREKLNTEICNALLTQGIEPEIIQTVKLIVTIKLDAYEIQERTTELTTVDQSDYDILKMYASCLLTEGKSKNTVTAYIQFLKRYISDICKPVREVMTSDIRLYLAKLQTGHGVKQVSMRTIENYRSYLSAFYMWMSKEELIDNNPMEKIPPVKFPEKDKKDFSDVELDALRSCSMTKRNRAILEMLLSSGVRVSELCQMNIADVDFQTLEVSVKHAKGGKVRKTYINPVCAVHLKDYLNSRKDNNPSLIINKMGSRITKRNVEDALHLIQDASGVDNVHPHRCRRHFASSMLKRGMDIRTIQILLGHSNLNTTSVYLSVNSDTIKNEYRRYS